MPELQHSIFLAPEQKSTLSGPPDAEWALDIGDLPWARDAGFNILHGETAWSFISKRSKETVHERNN